MSFFHTLATAITGLKTNKVRSLLTILGIVIGVSSIIMIMSLGQGANSMIMNQISGWGATTVALEPGAIPEGIADMAEIYTDSIGERDLIAVKKKSNVPNVDTITPFVISSEGITYEGERSRGQIIGSTAEYLKFLNVYPDEGTLFGEDDIESKNKVAIIGWQIKDDLFGESDAVGQKVKIKGQWFRIIGTFPKTGTVAMQNVDKMVLAPYSTIQEYLTGTNYFQGIILKATEEQYVKQVAEDVKITIRDLHGITDEDKDDFHVGTMDQAANIIGTVTGTLTFFLGAVAAISLIVGGIGIMNIMLVSVTERTREIGLRKALGATSENILFQFLLESVILTGIGGIIGILLGASLSLLITYAINTFANLGWVFVFPISGAILGVGVSSLTGLIFGIYPAKKAAKKSPIEALRYE